MIKKFFHIAKKRENRQVISNVFSLSALQFANTILPLVTIPYIVRIIGPKNYGTIAFAQAFAMYFVLLITYGFDLTASREISQNRTDLEKVKEIFWTVIWSRVFLFAISTLVFSTILLWVPQVRSNFAVMIVSYLFVIGTVTFPTWFFQGIEKLGLTAIFNFIVKVITTGGVFIFLHKEEDYIIVPLLLTVGQIVAGAASLVYTLVKYVGWLRIPHLKEIIHQLKSGFTLFISTVFINFYTVSNTVILAFFASQESVGYFAAGSRIVGALRSLTIFPIGQAMFPYVAKLMKENQEKGVQAMRKLMAGIIIVTIPVSLGLLIFATPIVNIVLGKEFEASVNVVRIISFFPLIVGLGNVFGIQGLLNLKQDRLFLKLLTIGCVLDLGLNCILDTYFREVGAAIAWLLSEIYMTVAFFFALKKVNINMADISFYRQWLSKNADPTNV